MSGTHRGFGNPRDDEPRPGVRDYYNEPYEFRWPDSPQRDPSPPRQHSPSGCQECRRFHNNNHQISPPRSQYRSDNQGYSRRRSPSPRRHYSSNYNSGDGPYEPVRLDDRYYRSPSYDHRNSRNPRNPGRYSPDEMMYGRQRSPSDRYRSHGENRRRYDHSYRSPSPVHNHRETSGVSPSPYRGLLEMVNRNSTAQDRHRHHQDYRDSHQDRAAYDSRSRHGEREHRGYRDEAWNDSRRRSPSYSRSPPPHQYNYRSYRQQNGVYGQGSSQRPPSPTESHTSSWSNSLVRRQSTERRASSPSSFELIESNALQAPIFVPQDYQINYHMENVSLEEEQPGEVDPVDPVVAQIEEMKQEFENGIVSRQDSNQEANQEDQENQEPEASADKEEIPYHGLSFWFNPPGKRRRKPTQDAYLTRKPHRYYYFRPKVFRPSYEPDDSEELPTVSEEFRQELGREIDEKFARKMQRHEERWGWNRAPVWKSTTNLLKSKFDKVASKQTLDEAGLASSQDWYTESPPTSPPQSRPSSPVLHSMLNRKIYPADYQCVDLQNVCIFCGGEHPADGCIKFKDVEKRREFLVEKNRCLRCFGFLQCHEVDPCKKLEETCKYCYDKDPEDLHHPAICREPKPLFGTTEVPTVEDDGDDDW